MSDGPTGEVVVGLGRFTTCVDADDFEPPPDLGLGVGPGGLGKKACDFLLGGKLVCLGAQRCAIGTVVHIEPVGYQKPFPDDIDNDFSVNLLLFPHTLDEFSPGGGKPDALVNWAQVTGDGVQGSLILHDPALLPKPNEPAHQATPYTVPFLYGEPGGPRPYERHDDKAERGLEEIKQDASGIKRVPVPVLHCEFEGSRIFAVCSAIGPLLDAITGGPGAGACRAALGWIPFVGDAICTAVEWAIAAALAPVVLAVAAGAWVSSGIADELLLTGPVSRRVQLGDNVIVTGRWVWDGGHSGWNELHATFTLQQVVLPDDVSGLTAAEATTFVDRWCGLVDDAPPGTAGQALTPGQQETADRQARPEHQWVWHPAVDGCAPAERDPTVPR